MTFLLVYDKVSSWSPIIDEWRGLGGHWLECWLKPSQSKDMNNLYIFATEKKAQRERERKCTI
jgi:hypothetical protein